MFKSAGLPRDNELPLSLAVENRVSPGVAVAIAGIFFALFFSCWLGGRELLSQEGLYASCAAEYQPGMPITAHGVPRPDIQPLFPASAALLSHVGVPMENALRLLSVAMLAAWSILAASIAARRRNYRAGIVTFFCCAGTIFAMDKGVHGLPVAMTAFFLLAGQLVFFHFGSRLANWNKAWLSAVVLWILAFLAGGPIVLLYIIMPILFLRRPLSVRSKFNAPGFFAACVLMGLTVLWRVVQSGYNLRMDILPVEFSSWEYIKQILLFPLVFPVRMLPWSLLTWLPFCTALQEIDQTPVFSRYLRIIFIISFGLAWLLPNRPSVELFYVAGPLAIMTGINYDLGIRRYWKWFRKALFVGEILLFAAALAMAGIIFLPSEWLERFFVSNYTVLDARYKFIVLSAAAAVILVMAIFFHLQRRTAPIWQLVVKIMVCCAIFCNVLLLPKYWNNRRWQNLGSDISAAFPADEKVDTLYKLDIEGMYCGLFYAGVPVKKIRSLDELPQNKTIFIISSGFPRHFGWRWTPLLPPDYRFEGEPLAMWCGVPVPPEKEEDGDIIQ